MENIKKKIKIIFDGVLFPFIVYFAITIFVAVVIDIGFKEQKDNLLLLQCIINIVLAVIMIPLYISYRKKNGIVNKKFETLGAALYLIPIAFGLCVFGNVLLSFFLDISDNPVSKEMEKLLSEGSLFVPILSVGISAPIIEEILFRGYIYDAMKILTGKDLIAIIVSSLLFGVFHGNLVQGIYGTLCGLALGYIRKKYDNIFASMIVHVLMNMIVVFLGMAFISTGDVKYKLFITFIGLCIFIFSMIRINIKSK